jgi:hypothetical protein
LYGHHPEYQQYLKTFVQVRVVLMQELQVEVVDAHTYLGMVHGLVRMEYIKWLRGRSYFVNTRTGIKQSAISPVWTSLGQWAADTMLKKNKNDFAPLVEQLRQRIVELWNFGMQGLTGPTPPLRECERVLTAHNLSLSSLLAHATYMVWGGEVPVLVS